MKKRPLAKPPEWQRGITDFTKRAKQEIDRSIDPTGMTFLIVHGKLNLLVIYHHQSSQPQPTTTYCMISILASIFKVVVLDHWHIPITCRDDPLSS